MKFRKRKKILKNKVLNKTNGVCAHCGKNISTTKCTITYFIPKSKGGIEHDRNFIPLCKVCSKYKKSRIVDIDEFGLYLPEKYKEQLRANIIYSLNNIELFETIRDYFELPSDKLYEVIQDEFLHCTKLLQKKGISYRDLKKALIPTKELRNREVAFWFDTNKIENVMYGYEVMSQILPLLDKNSTCSFLIGDYIDIIDKGRNSQLFLQEQLLKNIKVINDSEYLYSGQYYVIYISNITETRVNDIVEGLKGLNYFYGYTDLYSGSMLKSYLSAILVNGWIKSKNRIILPNPEDEIETNVNIYGYPFEENNFRIFSFNDDLFNFFLSYKIESLYIHNAELSISLNAIYPKLGSMDELEVEIPDKKWSYLTRTATKEKNGKGGIIESLDPDLRNPASFAKAIKDNLCNNYIYNLKKNEYGIISFDTFISMKTSGENLRKTLIVLKYYPEDKKLSLETIT